MPDRHFPVRPNLEQLKHQAKDMLRGVRAGDAAALAEFARNHPRQTAASEAKLADAQLALARSYGLPNWARLVLACQMTDAIWRGDAETVRALILKNPELLREDARGVKGNWGPPMSYAANLGRDEIIAMLRELGADDVQQAFIRACLQGKIETAGKLHAMGGQLVPGMVMGPCETLHSSGLKFVLALGARFRDASGDRLAPVALILQTYSRYPQGKHESLEIAAAQGIALPDTAPMAAHRGRIDLLEKHLRHDANLLSRTFSHEEIYPPELGCHADHSLALHGTPLAGTTLLHLCVDYDELEIAKWLLEKGADVNARAAQDAEGFGGHTALFGCVVSQAYRCGLQKDGTFARLLLKHGADANARASLRKRLRFVGDEAMREFRGVTPLSWGERFPEQDWVNREAMRLITERGGKP